MKPRLPSVQSSGGPPRLLYLITIDWFFVSHFRDRAVAAREAGFDVLVGAQLEAHHQQIRDAGLTPIQWNVVRRGINPIRELRSLIEVWQIYREYRPDLVHHIAMKPIIYGSLAARLTGIRRVLNAPVGMGFVYSSTSMIARGLRPLLELMLRALLNPRGSLVVFENRDDFAAAVSRRLVRADDAILIRGAGVDLTLFAPAPEPTTRPRVVLIARMLWDKGVGEFVAAARLLKSRGREADFVMVGAPDSGNRASISGQQLRAWQAEGVIEWLGHRTDVPAILAGAHIVALPSYREGLPKSLLEALAAGRPIVTTDVPGCREVVNPGVNGLLVPVHDAVALADALDVLICDPARRKRFGRQSRLLAEVKFGLDEVNSRTLNLYVSLMRNPTTGLQSGHRCQPRVAFFVTVDWYFASHYLALACAIRDAGYEVSVITDGDDYSEQIRAAGIDFIPFPISRKGMHPVAELKSLLHLVRVLRCLRPDLLHNIAQKPVLYGSLAARLTGVPAVVAALPGLGWLFTSGVPRARLGRRLVLIGYRFLLRNPRVRVLVQNETDRAELRHLAGLDAILIPGSGVDLERYQPHPSAPLPVTIMLASRLLWDKGVSELVGAMRLLHKRGVACRCCLIGEPDDGNPASVSRQWLEARVAEGVIEWWGFQGDMPAVLLRAHIACLPSYREGLPKFLLEASAAGLPLVATDVPGCRDVVQDGINGLLIPKKTTLPLADALQRLIEDADLRALLGRRARAIAEAKFGNERISSYVNSVYASLLKREA